MERNLKGDEMMDTSSLELCMNSFRHVDYSMMTREETTGRSDLYAHSPPGEETRQLDADKLQEEGRQELKRIRSEHKKLTQMVMGVREDVDAMHTQLLQLLLMKNNNVEESRKRKSSSLLDSYDWRNNTIIRVIHDQDSLYKRPAPLQNKQRSFRVLVTSDPSDIKPYGYHWRKYGQKVTRDNLARAYYKCSFSPSCPVKKKVQRSGQDPSILEATYQGEHNHHFPSYPTTQQQFPAALEISPTTTTYNPAGDFT